MRKNGWIIVVLAVSAADLIAAEKPGEALISFDSVQGLTCERGYKCVEAVAEAVEHDRREGSCSIRTTWKAAADNYALMTLTAEIPPTDFGGKSFSVAVKPLNDNGSGWGVELIDADGKTAERHRLFHVGANRWTTMVFNQGVKIQYGWFQQGDGDIQRITRVVLRAQTRAAGQTGEALWDDFRLVSPVATENLKRAPDLSGAPATLSNGGTAVWLDASQGYALRGMRLAGRWLEPALRDPYPVFHFLDEAGKPKSLACSDAAWTTKGTAEGPGKFAVTYTTDGAAMRVLWTAEDDAVQCDVSVVAEGALKAAEVEAGRIFGAELAEGDYGIPPTGWLASYTKEPIVVKGAPEKRTALFLAAKTGDRILFYKPLTASQQMELVVREAADGKRLAWMGGSLHFRPAGFKDPKTKLCHSTLSWRAEAAGDVNRDGAVDWVDCGIAYRDRYVKPNEHKSPAMRDSYRFYHIHVGYDRLAELAEKIDFATGVWWIKGMMKTNMSPASEAHPYVVERAPRGGDLAPYKERILATGATIGPYYGHDYIDLTGGDWPDELVKRDAAGGPHKYYVFHGRQLHYKDNVRGLATGSLKKHYEQILEACWMQKGDTLMLDTFTAYARPGFHPDYPATVQGEIDAKHELARWLKRDKGLVVAGEAIIDGTQDVVDYGAVTIDLLEVSASAPWNRGWVPIKEVIFHGSSYFGCATYSVKRGPKINYAAALASLVGFWQWSTFSSDKPDHIYNMVARDYFFEDIFWSRVADQKIVGAQKNGTEFTYTFDNGSVLWVDPEKQKYWLEEGGVRYDGFTPFNNKGVMAILDQGDFDLVLPVREMLEILPSQPHRDKLLETVSITKEPDGRIRVKGNFSQIPFKVVFYDKDEKMTWVDAPPVLMLSRVAAGR